MSELLDMKLESISNYSTPSKNNINKNTRARALSNSKDSGKETNITIAALNELSTVQTQLAAKIEENDSLKRLISQSNKKFQSLNNFQINSSPSKFQRKNFSPKSSSSSFLKHSPSLDSSLKNITIDNDNLNNDNYDIDSQKDSVQGKDRSPPPLLDGIIVPFRPDTLGSERSIDSNLYSDGDNNILLYDAAVVDAALAQLREDADKLIKTPSKILNNKLLTRRFSESDVSNINNNNINNVFYDMDLSRDEEDSLSYADSMSPMKAKSSIKPFMRTLPDLTVLTYEQEEERKEEVTSNKINITYFLIF